MAVSRPVVVHPFVPQSLNSSVNDAYSAAADPQQGSAFPLHGAVLGCIAGSQGTSTANSLGIGRWNGKIFG